jgi:hypothetical protein
VGLGICAARKAEPEIFPSGGQKGFLRGIQIAPHALGDSFSMKCRIVKLRGQLKGSISSFVRSHECEFLLVIPDLVVPDRGLSLYCVIIFQRYPVGRRNDPILRPGTGTGKDNRPQRGR